MKTCHPDILSAAVIFDSEEVGSQSLQGAGSTFLKDCLERINMTLGYTQEDYLRALAGSFLISADNGHGLHPNYPGKSDPTHHPYLNGGILVRNISCQSKIYLRWSLQDGIIPVIV